MKKGFQCYENVPGQLAFMTNVKDFFWGFGHCRVPVSEEAFKACKIRVILEERPDRNVFDGTDLALYDREFRHFKAAAGKGTVIFNQTIRRAVRLRYVLTVEDGTVHMVVGKSYRRFVKTKLMYIHPVEFILFDVVSLLLLKKGMTTLYCSAVCLPGEKTVVFAAPPNTGKSLCALKLRREAKAEILAEDMAITDGKQLWGAPHTHLYRNYHDSSLTDFDSTQVRSSAVKVDFVAVLQKGSQKRLSEPADFQKRWLLINRYSLGYYYSPCVRVLSYYNDSFSISQAEKTEESILRRLQGGARCVLLENNNPMDFSNQIKSLIN